MLKIVHLIGFTFFYLSAHCQKAYYYQSKSADLNKYSYFYIENGQIDAHQLSDPFISIIGLNVNEYKDFVIYNELSLKNMTIVDGETMEGGVSIKVYEGSKFDEVVMSGTDYKPKRLKGRYLIIDMMDSFGKALIWRGWVDLKKIKAKNENVLYQRAVMLILQNFKINPIILE